VEDLKHARHNLRGKLNALKLCVSAFEVLQTRQEELEFLEMIEQTADATAEAMEEFDAVVERIGVQRE
jgi:hypothetical protein